MNYIVQANIFAACQILVIIVLRALLINNIRKHILLLFWYTALIKLILPSTLFTSKISIMALFNHSPIMLATNNNIGNNMALSNALFDNSTPNEFIQNDFLKTLNVHYIAIGIWIIIALLMFTFFSLSHFYHVMKFKTASLVNELTVNSYISHMNYKRKIVIKESQYINSPLTYGVIRPIILFPVGMDYTDFDSIKYVLVHELFHISRFDVILKWILLTLLCVYWFNPFVWFMYVLCSRDIELSCDEFVIRRLGISNRKKYALLLINLESKRGQFRSSFNNFGKNAIEERIISIMKIKNNSRTIIISALACAIVLIGTFCFTALAQTDEPKQATTFSPLIDNNIFISQTDSVNSNIIFGYDLETEKVVISPDGGANWVENDYKDPKTNLTYHVEDEGFRTVSPDDGKNWYSEYYVEGDFIMCSRSEVSQDGTEIQYMAISEDGGMNWNYSKESTEWISYEDYEKHVNETIEFMSWAFENNEPFLDKDSKEYFLTQSDVDKTTTELYENLEGLRNGTLKISSDLNKVASQ